MVNWESSLSQFVCGGNQGASLPQSEWKVSKRLLYLGTWDHWEASLSQFLNCGWPRGFSTSIWMEGNQGASLPQNHIKVSSFFSFFVGKFVGFMFCWELNVETLSFCCCLLLLKLWTLYDLVGNSCAHVVILALGHFLNCRIIWHGEIWTMLMTHEIWQCL